MIEKLEKISTDLFKQSLKTYTMKDVTYHKKISYKNLLQMCSMFPNKGVGFAVRRKSWPSHVYWIIRTAKYKSVRFGKLYGVKFAKGINVSNFPLRIRGTNKRGTWEFDLHNFDTYTTDNAITYNRKDFLAFCQCINHQALNGLDYTPETSQNMRQKNSLFDEEQNEQQQT